MITGVTGLPGDGKSLYCMRPLLEDLVRGDCLVVTNLPLRLKALHRYVTKRFQGEWEMDKYLKVIERADIFEFYRFRSGGLVLPHSPDAMLGEDEGAKRMGRQAFDSWMEKSFLAMREKPEYQLPVHFYIDEAHKYFDSREWASIGRGVSYYATQHRHLHDEIFLLTQFMEQIEKRLRNLIGETVQCRNNIRRSIGVFKMRPQLIVRHYYRVPTQGQAPFAKSSYAIDMEQANCYKTCGALGVHDSAEQIKNKGILPWWTMWAGGGVAVAALMTFMYMAPHLLSHSMKIAQPTTDEMMHKKKATEDRAMEMDSANRMQSAKPHAVAFSGVMGTAGSGLFVAIPGEGWVEAMFPDPTGGFWLRDGRYARPESHSEMVARVIRQNKEYDSMLHKDDHSQDAQGLASTIGMIDSAK